MYMMATFAAKTMTMTMKTNLLPKLYKAKPVKIQHMAFISKQINKTKKHIEESTLTKGAEIELMCPKFI